MPSKRWSRWVVLGVLGACGGSEPEPCVEVAWYVDSDGDGYGVEFATKHQCVDPGPGYAVRPGDCEDQNPAANPGVQEVCDGVDNDCDRVVDEPDAIDAEPERFADNDQDGWGAEALGPGCLDRYQATRGGDCNDYSSGVHPGMNDRCDGFDSDCDGLDAKDVVSSNTDVYPTIAAAVAAGESSLTLCDGLIDWVDNVRISGNLVLQGGANTTLRMPDGVAATLTGSSRLYLRDLTLEGGGVLAQGSGRGVQLSSVSVTGARPAAGQAWLDVDDTYLDRDFAFFYNTTLSDIRTENAPIIDISSADAVNFTLGGVESAWTDLVASAAPLVRMSGSDPRLTTDRDSLLRLDRCAADGAIFDIDSTGYAVASFVLDGADNRVPWVTDVLAEADVTVSVRGLTVDNGGLMRVEAPSGRFGVVEGGCVGSNAPCAWVQSERSLQFTARDMVVRGVDVAAPAVLDLRGDRAHVTIESSEITANRAQAAALALPASAWLQLTDVDFGEGDADNDPVDIRDGDGLTTSLGLVDDLDCRSGLSTCP